MLDICLLGTGRHDAHAGAFSHVPCGAAQWAYDAH